jgi:hypothetical protein
MKRSDGVIYLNLNCYNPIPSGRNIPVAFNQQSLLNIVEDISRYNIQVVRFTAPTTLIPSIVIDPELAALGQTGYTCSMSIGASIDTENIAFNSDVVTSNNNISYFSYYSRFELLNYVNDGLAAAYAAMLVIDPTLPVYPPYIHLNLNTQLYELWMPQGAIQIANPVSIYFNNPLSSIFNLPSITDPLATDLYSRVITPALPQNIRYQDSDIITMARPFYVYSSDIISKDKQSFQKLIITADYGLPTQSEYTQSPASASNSNNPTMSSMNILTDFEPDHGSQNSGFLQFQSSGVGNARLIEFTGTGHIQSFTLRMYFQLFDNNVYPMQIRAGEGASIKLAFVPKSFFISNLEWN